MVFSLFKTEDGLARGTTLWKDCIEWLKNVDNDIYSQDWSTKNLCQYVSSTLGDLIQVKQGKDKQSCTISEYISLTVSVNLNSFCPPLFNSHFAGGAVYRDGGVSPSIHASFNHPRGRDEGVISYPVFLLHH